MRKCVVLGGRSGSEELRDWATRELKGYSVADELPEYRRVPAQIQIDGATMTGLVTGQPIARSSLPDFVREHIREEVEMRDGVGAIEELIRTAETTGARIKLSLPMGGDVARIMNADLQGQRILSIYWAVAPVALHGVLDPIRTALTLLVAELRAHTPEGEAVPSADVASQAVQVVVSGKRHKVSVNTAQAAGAPASVDTWSRRVGQIRTTRHSGHGRAVSEHSSSGQPPLSGRPQPSSRSLIDRRPTIRPPAPSYSVEPGSDDKPLKAIRSASASSGCRE